MRICSATCKKIVAFCVAGVFIVLGSVAVALWDDLYRGILKDELTLSNTSKGYDMWKVTPIPMYLSFYLYNWTNSKEVLKDWSVKPHFVECGPYVFNERHERVNVQWNDNFTITYQQTRRWHFRPDLSNGTLQDNITNLNVIATTVAYVVRNQPFFVKEIVSALLNKKEKSLAITKTANEWLFEGFEDEVINWVNDLHIPGIKVPFDKFGWFYARNDSAEYDGNFTMYTGSNDLSLLGIFEEWNGSPKSPAYKSYCGYVNGTSGELWPPVEKYSRVSVFSPDICSSVALFQSNVTPNVLGIEGKQYIGTDYLFDNGTKYPEMECFNGAQTLPSGVRDVSKCKFGAPAFISYPHFYLADPSYLEAVDGLDSDQTDFAFTITLEPSTGVPLDVNAQFQINLYIQPIKHISMFEKVRRVMIPMMWFKQTATLTEEYSSLIKLLLTLPAIGQYTGYGLIALGLFISVIALVVSVKDAWKDKDEELLPEKAL